MNLLRFQRPSRYIDGEVNAIKKDARASGGLRVALAFPDIYDVGMSHLGLKILYDIINRLPYASAERAFHPWLDMDAAMRGATGASLTPREGGPVKGSMTPLSSLETNTPLYNFDIVGFSLQYELSYTAVLNMLRLGAIPLKSSERDDSHPIIIAGGPSAVNPLPMSPFIDAFLIGDGEEAAVEIMDAVHRFKKEGDGKRETILKALSGIEGVYVPSLHKAGECIKRRYIDSLDDAPYPVAPIVPYTQIVHDRVNIEVSRGCTMGCRFCQAGMIYRPLRERSPQKVLDIAAKSLKSTGYEEVAFTSLSAGDYSQLLPLLKAFKQRFDMVSVSLPSLRVKAVNREMLREIKSVRKTGFTIAPEAATARLRAVINKDFSEEDYEKALEALFSEGWQNLKLYFMIGLPTETDSDVEAIQQMALKAIKVARKHTGRYVNVSVAASPFVPKPHTPFQWCGQDDMAELKRKKDYLRGALRKLNVKGHDVEMSMLEAAFARGDEKLAALIEAAYNEGARLDGWTESFDFNIWLRAMEKTGIDAFAYAKKEYKRDEPLPWDMVDTGVSREFILGEYDKALTTRGGAGVIDGGGPGVADPFSESITPDCRQACLGCGLDCKSAQEDKPLWTTDKIKSTAPVRSPVRIRARFSKTGTLRYLSHFELVTAMTRALRRAGVVFDHTKGFHPTPRIAFGPPLSVGLSGLREYLDMVIIPGTALSAIMERTNAELPDGLRLHDIAPVGADEPSLQDFISKYEYEIGAVGPLSIDCMAAFVAEAEVLAEREKGPVNIRPMVESAAVEDGRVRVVLRDLSDKKVRLDEIVKGMLKGDITELNVTRLATYGMRRGLWAEPLEERRPQAIMRG